MNSNCMSSIWDAEIVSDITNTRCTAFKLGEQMVIKHYGENPKSQQWISPSPSILSFSQPSETQEFLTRLILPELNLDKESSTTPTPNENNFNGLMGTLSAYQCLFKWIDKSVVPYFTEEWGGGWKGGEGGGGTRGEGGGRAGGGSSITQGQIYLYFRGPTQFVLPVSGLSYISSILL